MKGAGPPGKEEGEGTAWDKEGLRHLAGAAEHLGRAQASEDQGTEARFLLSVNLKGQL